MRYDQWMRLVGSELKWIPVEFAMKEAWDFQQRKINTMLDVIWLIRELLENRDKDSIFLANQVITSLMGDRGAIPKDRLAMRVSESIGKEYSSVFDIVKELKGGRDYSDIKPVVVTGGK